MNATMFRIELLRIVRDPITMFFTTVLPAFLYYIFGASMEYGHYKYGTGNVSFYIMVGMAAYGAVSATVGIGGSAAVERMQGWGRQLGLTPMRDRTFVAAKSLVAVVLALIPVTLVYALGLLTGAKADVGTWLAAYAITLAGASLFALYGLCFGFGFRSEAAVSAASGSLVILGFLGNLFAPLSGMMLTIAKFTPLYGYAALARYPMTKGEAINMGSGATTFEPLWQPLVNVGAWVIVFGLLALWLVRRSRARQ